MRRRGAHLFERSVLPAAAGLLIALLGLGGGCKSPVMPKDGEADIIIVNDYGQTLNIFLNGEYLYPLNHNQSVELDNLKFGVYYLEARAVDTDVRVDSEEVDVKERTDYTWTIDDPPDINVINNFGMTLRIFMDGVHQFDLLDEENRWILDVPYGEHFLLAVREADGIDASSITLKIEENTDFSWTIEKIN